MSRQTNRGTWIIPAHQAREFNREIDYTVLIGNCLADRQVSSCVAYGKKTTRDPDYDLEIEIDESLRSDEWYERERSKSIFKRDIKSLFKRTNYK